MAKAEGLEVYTVTLSNNYSNFGVLLVAVQNRGQVRGIVLEFLAAEGIVGEFSWEDRDIERVPEVSARGRPRLLSGKYRII